MKQSLFALAALFLTSSLFAQDFRAQPPEPGPAPEVKLGDFQDFELDNGLKVVLVENHKLPRVSYQLYVDVPPHMEGEYAGAGDLAGQMLRRATGTKTKAEIDEEIDFIGANLSTSANGAYASAISRNKEQVLEMMAQVVLDARFPEEEFTKVKEEAKANLKAELETPGAIASRVRRAVTFGPAHPYGELMTPETLENIDLDVVKQYYERYFIPNRSYLVMVGDLTMKEARMMAMKYFAGWKLGEVNEVEFPEPPLPEGVTVNFVPREGAVQSSIRVVRPLDLEPGTKESIRAQLLNTSLGGGFAGRLLNNLREDKGYTYGAYSGFSSDPLVGNFRANAEVRNEVTDSAIVEFLYELNKIAEEGVTEDELQTAKSIMTGSFGRALESPERIAQYALNTMRYDLDRDFYPEYLQRAQKSSANDVREVAEDLLGGEGYHIIVVGDPAVADKLARFASNGKVNYLDANGKTAVKKEMGSTDLTPQEVIDGYVEAIGGQAAIDKVENYSMTMEASVQGMTVQQKMVKAGGDRLSSQTTAMGMTQADQRYNRGKVKVTQMGQAVPESSELSATLKEEAALFPTADLAKDTDQLTLVGTEDLNGTEVVVLTKEGAAGQSKYYFDTETMLLQRLVQPQGPAKVTYDLSDYRVVDGVKFPHTLSIVGMAPFPIEMKMTELAVNTEIDEAVFSVE